MALFKKREKISETSNTIFVGSPDTIRISALFPNEIQAFDNSSVWAAVRYLSTMIGTLPAHVFKKDGNSRMIDTIHPVAKVLNNPNPYMTKSVFFEVMTLNLELFGVAYAQIKWTSNTQVKYPIQLFPISPRDIQTIIVDSQMKYKYLPTGLIIDAADMLVVMGITTNGLLPLNPIKYMSDVLDISSDAIKQTKKMFQRGSVGGIITTPANYTPEDKQRIATAFEAAQNNNVVLNEGIKYEPIKLNAEDAQLIQQNTWNLQEVARRFGISPYALGDYSHATFSNVEQQGINDVRNTFRPRIVKFEEALNQKLFQGTKDKENYYIRINMEGLLRGDTSARYNAYHIGLQDGFLNVDEVRALEDKNPLPDGSGSKFFVPLNFVSRDVAINYVPQGYVPVMETVEEKPEAKPELKKEELLSEAYFIEERKNVSLSKKAEIERLMRKILKQEIALMKSQLQTFNQEGIEGFKQNFSHSVNAIGKEYEEQIKAVFSDIANRTASIVKKELHKDTDLNFYDLESFIDKYVSNFLHRHSGTIVSDVIRTLEKASQESAEEDLNNLASSWTMELPKATADEEVSRAGNAIARACFLAYGISKLKAVASADACEFCQQLNGKIVSIEGSFLDKGQSVEDGEGNVVVINKKFSAPPFHRGCHCGIAPVQ